MWEKVGKSKPETIPAGKTFRYTYVFSAGKDSPPLTLTYKGTSVTELKAKEQLSQ